MTETAIRYKVSRKTVYKWLGRYDGTLNSLMDHSHRPKTSPRSHSEQELRQIRRRLKRHKWTDLLLAYWKQWKKIKTKYRMLKALGMEHWKAKELACSRKGYWRMAQVLNQIFSNKIIAKLGYTSMLDYYLIVYEN